MCEDLGFGFGVLKGLRMVYVKEQGTLREDFILQGP